MAIEYHDPDSCNYCGGINEVTVTDTINGHIMSGKTTCKDCGKNDYWDTGFFESSAKIDSKCRKYSFR